LACDDACQLDAVQELHHNEEPSAVLGHVIDRDNVRMGEPGRRLGFPEEAGRSSSVTSISEEINLTATIRPSVGSWALKT
jgi:hypothetical protein